MPPESKPIIPQEIAIEAERWLQNELSRCTLRPQVGSCFGQLIDATPIEAAAFDALVCKGLAATMENRKLFLHAVYFLERMRGILGEVIGRDDQRHIEGGLARLKLKLT